MRKLNKVLAVLLSATMLFGCSSEPKEPTIAKVGFGMVSDNNGTQVNTTMCALAVDAEGKIMSVEFDVAQQKFADDAELRTKGEKKEDYNMKNASPIGKEWYEQVDALEAYLVGKTVADFTGLAFREHNNHTDVAPEGSDLYAVTTISLTGFLGALKEAEANLAAVEGVAKVTLGHDVSVTKDSQINTSVVVLALDKDAKVVKAFIDVQQTKVATTDFRSKMELQGDYNMKNASPIGKEWFEQAEGMATWLVGKTVTDFTSLQLREHNNHTDVAPEGSDLYAVTTISLSGIKGALTEAWGK